MLGVTSLLIAFVWRGVWLLWFPPIVFRFWMGSLLLIELAVLMRHLRNIVTFRQMAHAGDITGQISYSRWWTLRSSALDLALFAGLFALLASIAEPWFFLGGALACAAAALRHLRYSQRIRVRG
jgi:hypothetical protein